MLTELQRDLLGSVLDIALDSGSLVECVSFRADHAQHRGELNALEQKSLLARDDNGIAYRVTVLGLHGLGSHRSNIILERGDALARQLEVRYRSKSTRNVPYSFTEISELWGVTLEECRLTLVHFRDVLYLWGAGIVNEFSSPDAGLLVTENILDCPTVTALIGKLLEWQKPSSDVSNGVTYPIAAVHQPAEAQNVWVRAWPAIRATLQEFSFYNIKLIAGLAGLDVTLLSHLVQAPPRSATKGELMSAVDAAFGRMTDGDQKRFLTILAEEVLRRRPDTQDRLEEYLSRLGWTFSDGLLLPLELFDLTDLHETPQVTHGDFRKAAQRLRDGDLTGAISAACGAVDSATAQIYREKSLGDPTDASFQERCRNAAHAKGVIPALELDLVGLGWEPNEIVMFKKNFEGALKQGAYVMQALRSRMGDVHGSKPIFRPLVFECLKWAELYVSALADRR